MNIIEMQHTSATLEESVVPPHPSPILRLPSIDYRCVIPCRAFTVFFLRVELAKGSDTYKPGYQEH